MESIGRYCDLDSRVPAAKRVGVCGSVFYHDRAVISHLASHDVHVQIIAPIVLAIFTVLSWWLRPADRKII